MIACEQLVLFVSIISSTFFRLIVSRHSVNLPILYSVHGRQQHTAMAKMNPDGKDDVVQKEVLHDHDVWTGRPSSQDGIVMLDLSAEELQIEKRVRFKIDVMVMPLVILVYLMNYIDRNNFAAAKLQGLVDDLHLTPPQYQTCLSILFVAYVRLVSRVRVRSFLLTFC